MPKFHTLHSIDDQCYPFYPISTLSAKKTLIRTLGGKQLETTWNTLVFRTPPFNASLYTVFLLERRCPQLGPYRSISSVFGRLECLTRVTRTLGSNFNL